MVIAAPVLGVPPPPDGAPVGSAAASTDSSVPTSSSVAPTDFTRELNPDGKLTPADERYRIRFEPSVFFAAPGGKLRLPGSPPSVGQIELQDFDLDRPRLSPFGELHVRSDDWRVSVSGFAVSLHDVVTFAPQAGQLGAATYNAGDRISSSISLASGEWVVARELGAPAAISGERDPDFAVSFEAFGGMRFYDVSFNIAAPTSATSSEQFYLQPILGVKTTFDITPKFTIDVQLSVGGFTDGRDHTSFSYDVLAGFMYRPVENVGIQVGYRLFIFDLTDGPDSSRFDYRGAVAGLYGGLVVRF